MKHAKRFTRSLLLASTFPFYAVFSVTWNTINDYRVTNKDITPVLGRGFSLNTGNVLSTCLSVNNVIPATADYEYIYSEIYDERTLWLAVEFSASRAKVTPTVAYEVELSANFNYGTKFSEHFIISTMLIERYYQSVDETSSALVSYADALLTGGNFLQFFQACGPTFFRSIRKTAEVWYIHN